MRIFFTGRARRLGGGDDINCDYIIASSRKKETLDESVLKRYLLESVDPGFAASVAPGDVLVAGRNFGCGSAMEIAVTVIQAAGIKAVLAQSFSRTFYRNAVNNGLVPVTCNTGGINEGDRLEVDLTDESLRVMIPRDKRVLEGARLPAVMLGILQEGGLAPYVRKYGGFRTANHG